MKRQAILLGSVLVLWATVPANGDLINGGFDTGNLFGWTSSGPVTVDAIGGTPPAAVLGEDEFLFDGTDLHQVFEIPTGPLATLSFTFAMFAEGDFPEPFPPDAFLVSLLDPGTLNPLVSTPGYTDFFAVEFDGFFEDFVLDYDSGLVEVAGLTDLTTTDVFGIGGMVTLDMSSLSGGTMAMLDFNLVGGFDGYHSSVFIDGVSAQVIPIPASVGLGLAGFASLAGFRLLRRRGSLDPGTD
ncbi:MAG: hypothetical protein WBE26_16660 [Phycisphaerae bacterium]